MQISRISIPNPFFEGRNSVYLIKSDPVTIIDSGVATAKAFETLCAELSSLGLTLKDIKRVVLTHKHIDHIGNAWRIQQEGDAEILIHESECQAVSTVDPDGAKFADLVNKRLVEWSVPTENRPATSSESSSMPRWEIEAAEVQPLVDGQELAFENGRLHVVHTPGHTLGSICLKGDSSLFSGDHVLPDISPNIGAGDMRHRGMLKKYLDSLCRVQAFDCEKIYPGHGEEFTGLAERCAELSQHHQQRLARIVEIIQERPKTVFEIAVELFGSLKDFHVVLGCAEANAHLELLLDDERIMQQDGYFTSQV